MNLSLADIGTGTGLFLSQLAQGYPDAILHGFDISPNLFPPQETLSPQVSLSVLNIKETPPSSLHDKYDIIHIRLLAAGINSTEWKPIVQNLLKLLKPGGAIQWEECNWMETQYYRSGINSSAQAACYMCARFKEGMKDKFSYGWKILPRIYDEFGMGDLVKDIVSSDRIVETSGYGEECDGCYFWVGEIGFGEEFG
ncbi:hypothetical protein BPAE_0071g00350 [Botrytis paeoniae]|uniref:Methyltransferase type 12 domain-containing protein n=1 Tax=Botrytis paeoniae TaxID=278948 RepID=A0A4Z1FLZ8_9HELO|nr:hypothetical protein BPAE_0071g00350 [Botrytis paeoniae]